MPRKQRRTKRRSTAPLEAWQMLFASGSDYLAELEEYGLSEKEAREAARDAWAVHGAAFMASWEPRPSIAEPHRVPWALQQFGSPPGYGDAD
jgi:hypothetical protein